MPHQRSVHTYTPVNTLAPVSVDDLDLFVRPAPVHAVVEEVVGAALRQVDGDASHVGVSQGEARRQVGSYVVVNSTANCPHYVALGVQVTWEHNSDTD